MNEEEFAAIKARHHGNAFNTCEGCLGNLEERMADNDCDVFEWIGQSLRTCDACGRPFWMHRFRRPIGKEMRGGPFSKQEEKPVRLSHAERVDCLLKWGTADEISASVKLP